MEGREFEFFKSYINSGRVIMGKNSELVDFLTLINLRVNRCGSLQGSSHSPEWAKNIM